MTWWHFDEAPLNSDFIDYEIWNTETIELFKRLTIIKPREGKVWKFLREMGLANNELTIFLEVAPENKRHIDQLEKRIETVLALEGLFGDGESEPNYFRYKEAYDPTVYKRGPISLQSKEEDLQAKRRLYLKMNQSKQTDLHSIETVDSSNQVPA